MPSDQPSGEPPASTAPLNALSSSHGASAFAEAFYHTPALLMGVVEVHDGDLLHIADNVAAARILGGAPHETVGRYSSEMGVPPHAIQRWMAPCRVAEKTGKPVEFEYERRGETETRIMEAHLEFLGRSENGAPRFSYLVKDVTDQRRRTEEAHRVRREKALERRATEILESFTDGFIALDRNFRFTFVNGEAERVLQRSREDLLGDTFWHAFPETVGLEVDRAFHRALREQVTCELEEYNPVLDTWFSARIYPSPSGLSVYFHDTTEQRKMEETLDQQHAAVELERRRLQAILDILPVGVFIADAEGRIVQSNPAARAIWGKRTPLSQSFSSYPEDYPAWWPDTGQRVASRDRALARALATGEVTIASERLIEAGDGKRKTVLNYALPIRDTNGETVGAVAVNVDITERKHLEEALVEQAEALQSADRAKDEFLAMLGHELRNPLGVIASATELLRRIARGREECREPVEVLQEQVRHMARLLDDLLDVSRITSGRLELRREPVDLHVIIGKAVEAVRPFIEEHGHTLSVVSAPGTVRVNGDAARLQQVLSNLLHNAAKYTPAGGCIWLRVAEDADDAVVRVRDNGVGIPPDLLPRIFEVFAQGPRPLDRASGGLGVGLAVVHRLVEMHGGTVEVHSDGPGEGSEFVLRFPRLQAGSGVPSQAAAEPADIHPLRILVVEDNVLARNTLKHVLESEGHCVDIAPDGPSALEAIQERCPDVVLLDIGLPGMDGYEVARRIRSLPSCDRLLLIAVTGYGQGMDIARSQEAGIDEHLVKPLNFERLSRLLGTRTTLAS